MSAGDKVAITCALSGTTGRAVCPAVPFSPEEYAVEAKQAYEAGAAQLHAHVRDPDTGAPSYEPERCRSLLDALRSAAPDALISLSTGGIGVGADERSAPILVSPDVATVSMGSVNYASIDPKDGRIRSEATFANTFADIQTLTTRMAEHGVIPEYEYYEVGHVANADLLLESGHHLPRGQHSLVLGLPGAAAATPENLVQMGGLIARRGHWEAVLIGQRAHWRLLTTVAAMGGSVRVGFEDVPFLPDGSPARSNGVLVELAQRMLGTSGFSTASPSDLRAALGATTTREA